MFKLVPDRFRFIVNYEKAKYIVWIKNDDVIKKQIEYDGEILTTRYTELKTRLWSEKFKIKAIKKRDQLDRVECFHNGIILIVNCFEIVIQI